MQKIESSGKKPWPQALSILETWFCCDDRWRKFAEAANLSETIRDTTTASNRQELYSLIHMFNLGSEDDPIAHKLGNFYESPFIIDDLPCGSAEGFIQSLKFADQHKQRLVASLAGKAAKFAGKKARKRLSREPVVFWQGRQIPFRSQEHMALIERGIRSKFAHSEACRKSLLLTGDAVLLHDTGFPESRFTSLKSDEFVRIVTKIRWELQQE